MRPQEETGAGPAALSGPVRHPDRKQLEGCMSARRCWSAASLTETRPDLRSCAFYHVKLKDALMKAHIFSKKTVVCIPGGQVSLCGSEGGSTTCVQNTFATRVD